MSRLDWSRASQRLLDPARYQRVTDFVTPDEVVTLGVKKRKRTRSANAERAAAAAHNKALIKRRRQKQPEVTTVLKKAKRRSPEERRALARQQKAAAAEKQRQKGIEQKEREKARRAVFAAYSRSPEYAEKLALEKAAIAAKKKSHLQAWVEEETGLDTDRETLRQRWRVRLLRRSTQS